MHLARPADGADTSRVDHTNRRDRVARRLIDSGRHGDARANIGRPAPYCADFAGGDVVDVSPAVVFVDPSSGAATAWVFPAARGSFGVGPAGEYMVWPGGVRIHLFRPDDGLDRVIDAHRLPVTYGSGDAGLVASAQISDTTLTVFDARGERRADLASINGGEIQLGQLGCTRDRGRHPGRATACRDHDIRGRGGHAGGRRGHTAERRRLAPLVTRRRPARGRDGRCGAGARRHRRDTGGGKRRVKR